ncbi:lysoplasmalogenase family protein, partial [Atopobiaceae bacterium HCP3S3_F7]
PLPGAALAVAGLALGAAGDVLHALRFVPEVKRRAHHLFAAGALSFLLGHLAYLGYLVPRVRAAAGMAGVVSATAAPALAGLALGGAVALSLSRGVRLGGRRALLGALYLLVLAQFLSFACAWWLLAPGAATGSLASGAALFLVSDSLLALNTFGRERTGARRAWSLGTYYAAQLFIALSLALPAAA